MLKKIVRLASSSGIAISLFAMTCSASADVLVGNFSDIKYWVGSGSNQAALVIDWNDSTTSESYTWGYRWDGIKTGEDMIRAVDLADVHLTIGLQFFAGLGQSFSSGLYDEDGNGTTDHSFNDAVDSGYWSYWNQETSSPFASGTWGFAATGMTGRTLANGSWDGWSWAAGPSFDEPGNNGPDAGLAAIPEPQTWVLLVAFGVTFLVRRRFRSSV